MKLIIKKLSVTPLHAVIALLTGYADVSARDHVGRTPLHIAWEDVDAEGMDTVQKFLFHGADANAKDHQGDTPLHSAVECGSSLEVVGLLIAAGADKAPGES